MWSHCSSHNAPTAYPILAHDSGSSHSSHSVRPSSASSSLFIPFVFPWPTSALIDHKQCMVATIFHAPSIPHTCQWSICTASTTSCQSHRLWTNCHEVRCFNLFYSIIHIEPPCLCAPSCLFFFLPLVISSPSCPSSHRRLCTVSSALSQHRSVESRRSPFHSVVQHHRSPPPPTDAHVNRTSAPHFERHPLECKGTAHLSPSTVHH